MDIHRCRFVPYVPQSINALAFSHNSNPKQNAPTDLRLAIGRGNGDIEIWNPMRGTWFQERILRGSTGRIIEQLAWTQDLLADEHEQPDSKVETGSLRLFSSGGSSSITEWDLANGVPKRHADGNAGDIWCFAPQPQWNSTPRTKGTASQVVAASSQLIAAGCSDGTVKLFATSDDDLRYERIVAQPPRKKSRVISIAWRDRNTLVIGYEASTIRVMDVRNRQVIREMSLGKPADGKNSVVWALTCLNDGTIVSGDSTGELKIWDSKNFSLVQRLKTHDADILDITASENGDIIYSCGVDRRTVSYRPIPAQADQKKRRWQQFAHRRYHQHDVKAITSYQSKNLSVGISGGMDAVPVVIPFRNSTSEFHRRLSHLPQKPQMSVSGKARLLLTWWSNDLYLWSIPKNKIFNDANAENFELTNDNRKLLAHLQLQGDENLTSAGISRSGDMLVASTSTAVKLFQIRQRGEGDLIELRSRQIDLPAGVRSNGASTVGFSPDGKWMFTVRGSNLITLLKLQRPRSPKDKLTVHPRLVKLDRVRNLKAKSNHKLGAYMRSIYTVAFSEDSRILAVGDISGIIHSWILEGDENLGDESGSLNEDGQFTSETFSESDSDDDSNDETDTFVVHGQKWIRIPGGSELPELDSAIMRLTFKPLPDTNVEPESTNGNVGLHPTRHTPHPVSHKLPTPTAGHLVAITSAHQIFEFDVLACKLTDWSRRNPPSMLPEELKTNKDRVMSSWWDCNSARGYERLWMYGTNWIVMIDMAQDLEMVQKETLQIPDRLGMHEIRETTDSQNLVQLDQNNTGKVGQKRKRGTGGGDEIAQKDLKPATVRSVKTFERLNTNSDQEDEDEQTPLAMVRRQEGREQVKMLPAKWSTFRFRSIYGACDIQTGTDNEKHHDKALKHHPEIVLVERPMSDVQLTPRFAGGQDWS